MVRMPVVAGRFYEGKEELLRQRIEDCFLKGLGPGRLPEGDPGSSRAIKALIAPHAGYMYSGMPAAHSYLRLFEDGKPEHIVILGPNHTGIGQRVAVCEDDWQTPMGVVRYDRLLGQQFIEENKYAKSDCVAHSNEHSIEVQLPFLQFMFGDDLAFIPISVGLRDYDVLESIGQTFADLAQEEDILLIASSDFTHFETADSAKKKDNQAMEFLEFMDPNGFLNFVTKHKVSICGAGPITSALVYANLLDATRFNLLTYTNSGDVTGDKKNVVAYVAGEFV